MSVPIGPVNISVCCCDAPGTTPPDIAPYVVSLNGLSGILTLDGQGAIEVTAIGGTIFLTLSASAGLGTVTQVAATAPASGFTIAGSPINTAGTFVFELSDDLLALENLASTGIACRTASDTWAQRLLQAPLSGLAIADPAGIAGNPTFSLTDDLAAVEGLATTGLTARTGSSTWATRSIAAPSDGISVFNGDGVSGNPTIAPDDDLAALEALSGTGFARRTGVNAWTLDSSIALATTNMTWVDELGSDVTGTAGRFDLPFATPEAARDASIAGDTIVVRAGDYTTATSLAKDGVNWFFYPGATVTFADDISTEGIFDDGGAAMQFTVGGYGNFTRSTTDDFLAFHLVNCTHSDSRMNIQGNSFTCTAGSDGVCAAFWGEEGELNYSANSIVSTGGNSYANWWINGSMRGSAKFCSSEYVAAGAQCSATPTGDGFFVADEINGIVSADGTNATAAMWVKAGIIVGSAGGGAVSTSNSNKLYVSAQKIFGSVRVSGGNVYVVCDKISALGNGGSTSANMVYQTSGTLRIKVMEYDPDIYTGQTIKITNGTQYIFGGRITGINGTNGFEIAGGTSFIQDMVIDTSASNSDNPVLVSGGTLKLNNCTLLAHSTRDSIEASGLQTVQIQTPCSATTAVDGSITLSPNAGYFVDSGLT